MTALWVPLTLAADTAPGTLIGFRNGSQRIVVVGVWHEQLETIHERLNSAAGKDLDDLESQLEVVGSWNDSSKVSNNNEIWLELSIDPTAKLPVFRSGVNEACGIVLYDSSNVIVYGAESPNTTLQQKLRHAHMLFNRLAVDSRQLISDSKWIARVERACGVAADWLNAPLPHGNGSSLSDISTFCCHIGSQLKSCDKALRAKEESKFECIRTKYTVRICIDIFLGIMACITFLLHSDAVLFHAGSLLNTFAIQRVGQGLAWVMGTPGGIKLNGPLTGFLANVFLQYLSWWAKILHALTPMTPFIPYFLAFIGCTTGISGFICAVWDCVRLCMLHLSLMAHFAGRLFGWTWHYLASTWRHFIGKKWNILRKRVDSSDLGIDQLLLNSVFFTTLLFLFPTILAYFVFFGMYRLVLVFGTICVHVVAVVTSRLPLYELALLMSNPDAYSDGLEFQLLKAPASARAGDYYLLTKCGPLRPWLMFSDYKELPRRIRRLIKSWKVSFLTREFML